MPLLPLPPDNLPAALHAFAVEVLALRQRGEVTSHAAQRLLAQAAN